MESLSCSFLISRIWEGLAEMLIAVIFTIKNWGQTAISTFFKIDYKKVPFFFFSPAEPQQQIQCTEHYIPIRFMISSVFKASQWLDQYVIMTCFTLKFNQDLL